MCTNRAGNEYLNTDSEASHKIWRGLQCRLKEDYYTAMFTALEKPRKQVCCLRAAAVSGSGVYPEFRF